MHRRSANVRKPVKLSIELQDLKTEKKKRSSYHPVTMETLVGYQAKALKRIYIYAIQLIGSKQPYWVGPVLYIYTYTYTCICIIYVKNSFPKRDKRRLKKMSLQCQCQVRRSYFGKELFKYIWKRSAIIRMHI